MSVNSYKVFAEVAKNGSFIRAAQALNLTPSAVSHSILSLEEDLGFPLFRRNRSGITLTQEGEAMLVHVRSIMNSERLMMEEAAEINGLERGSVTLGAFSSVCISWVPELVRTFQQAHRQIQVHVMQGDYADILTWVKEGEVDMAFETLPAADNMLAEPLHQDPLCCVLPRDMAAAHDGYITAEELRDLPLILQRTGYNFDTVAYTKKAKLSVSSNFFVEDDQSIAAMVQAGLGASLMPALTIGNMNYDVKILPLVPEFHRTIGLIRQKKTPLSPASRLLHDHILAFVKTKGLYNL